MSREIGKAVDGEWVIRLRVGWARYGWALGRDAQAEPDQPAGTAANHPGNQGTGRGLAAPAT